MFPIGFNQSSLVHLLLVTKNGLRLYLGFDESPIKNSDNEDYSRRANAVLDFKVDRRICKKWRLVRVDGFPLIKNLSDSAYKA